MQQSSAGDIAAMSRRQRDETRVRRLVEQWRNTDLANITHAAAAFTSLCACYRQSSQIRVSAARSINITYWQVGWR
jgi:hypothetical protein